MADQGTASAIVPLVVAAASSSSAGLTSPASGAAAAATPPPPPTLEIEQQQPQQQQQQQQQLEALDSSRGGGGGSREYRKGNWTLQETMILIQAKKMDDERRLKGGDKEKGKSAEFRWKWVENFCWRKGCQRSQNQCNDKWDNLLRDYKKVREFESKVMAGSSSSAAAAAAAGAAPVVNQKSYWQLEKHERKERGLPSNMIIQVYEALHEVVDKRPRPLLQQQAQAQVQVQQQVQQPFPQQIPLHPQQQQQQIHQLHQHQQHHHQQQHIFSQVHLPGPSSAAAGVPLQQATEVSKSTESEGSEMERSPSGKRRKVSREQGLAPTVSKSAYELSQTLLACEEKKDKRHRDLLGLEERKLGLEEAKTEISRQGMEGLIAAVNNLANAILTLVSDRQQPPG
ncbi:hypothetical protein SELMODRAFT_73941 [Selaginella moellendorffii]|uniref:Myb-like domain-containing protein n=1 Tax=Selaginella moellendorffii TaxID=88036 RepID=D8QQ41_SELML|nr:SUN domain-containing protein 2 [Selaginella moellendorffii]EFJ37725.1 hypothetical protein SELMODRAFT_73941 [Selaginella moellendorffii]|eukprot:XP_002960186.1 SUN domain-containing protein 2 [Selaginella moellendorffii]